MDNLLFALISLAMRWLEPRYNAQLQFLREQIRILRGHLGLHEEDSPSKSYSTTSAYVFERISLQQSILTPFTSGQLAQTGYFWRCGDIKRVRVYPTW